MTAIVLPVEILVGGMPAGHGTVRVPLEAGPEGEAVIDAAPRIAGFLRRVADAYAGLAEDAAEVTGDAAAPG